MARCKNKHSAQEAQHSAQLKKLGAELDSKQQRLTELQTKLLNVESSSEERAAAQIEHLTTQVDSLTRKLDSAEREKIRLQSALAMNKEDCVRLDQELLTARREAKECAHTTVELQASMWEARESLVGAEPATPSSRRAPEAAAGGWLESSMLEAREARLGELGEAVGRLGAELHEAERQKREQVPLSRHYHPVDAQSVAAT